MEKTSMFLVVLRLSNAKSRAGELMQAHNEWIKRGFADGVLLLAGSLQPGLGGVVIADRITRADLEQRLQSDPFIAHDVVNVDLLEVSPSKADPRLAFLLNTRSA
jgi:uncharacterized protein YciI